MALNGCGAAVRYLNLCEALDRVGSCQPGAQRLSRRCSGGSLRVVAQPPKQPLLRSDSTHPPGAPAILHELGLHRVRL